MIFRHIVQLLSAEIAHKFYELLLLLHFCAREDEMSFFNGRDNYQRKQNNNQQICRWFNYSGRDRYKHHHVIIYSTQLFSELPKPQFNCKRSVELNETHYRSLAVYPT